MLESEAEDEDFEQDLKSSPKDLKPANSNVYVFMKFLFDVFLF